MPELFHNDPTHSTSTDVRSARQVEVPLRWGRGQSATGALRWMILASLGCVANTACGGLADTTESTTNTANAGSSRVPTAGTGSGGSGSSVNNTGGTTVEVSTAGTSHSAGQAGNSPTDPQTVAKGVCEGGQEIGGGFVRCADGMLHRPRAEACPGTLPEELDPEVIDVLLDEYAVQYGYSAYPDAGVLPGLEYVLPCREHADCTDAEHGYCVTTSPVETGTVTFCRYGCESDADCGASRVCMCNGETLGTCVSASCQTDSECEGNLLCTNYISAPGCGGTVFACQMSEDSCTTDSQCAEGYCSADFVGGSRHCTTATCVIGRPFLVEGEARVAALVSGKGWCEANAARGMEAVAALGVALRGELAAAWQRAGLMEHASVAAFARFALQLMELGAPAELLEATTSAMQDETRHAKLCFGLAARYLGTEVGPGKLDVQHALEDSDIESVVLTAFEEGCIGETVAALEAAYALEHCHDEQVCEVLRQIVRDESAHAELAWRFVAWALDQAPELRLAIAARFARALADQVEAAPASLRRQQLLQNGVLPEETRAELRREALELTVRPCVEALLARAPVATAA